MEYFPKDFIETSQGLIFAVLDSEKEDGRILGFLRYLRTNSTLLKLTTKQANQYLTENFPQYIYFSQSRDTHIHGVYPKNIQYHYGPRQHIHTLKNNQHRDAFEEKTLGLVDLFGEKGIQPEILGVTGSILIGAQNRDSDIDLVIYDRANFFVGREIIKQSIKQGKLDSLNTPFWETTYHRRDPCLTLEEYIWHEQRKFNKAVYQGIKFDISFIDTTQKPIQQFCKKLGFTQIHAVVSDDRFAFDYPARYKLDHSEIVEALSFTPTYSGQAQTGESVVISGFIEDSQDGYRRIIVGSNREAPGEYIKVLSTVNQ